MVACCMVLSLLLAAISEALWWSTAYRRADAVVHRLKATEKEYTDDGAKNSHATDSVDFMVLLAGRPFRWREEGMTGL